MNLMELIREDLILTEVAESTREGVLRATVNHLVGLGVVANGDEVLRLLLEREQLMTTGVRPGVAIPHAFSEHVGESMVSVVNIPGGADWQALDGTSVYYVFLMLGPPQARGMHLRLLAHVSRLLSSPVFMTRLTESRTRAEILRAIESGESELALGGFDSQGGR